MSAATAIRAEGRKWIQTIQISLSQRMAYKLHFVLLIVGPTVVFFFVKFNLWSSIFSLSGSRVIGGYDVAGMLGYQAWVMVVGFLAQGYNGTNLAEDIRLGRISSHLIYPFEFWRFHAAGFIAFQGIQLVVACVTIAATVATGLVAWPGLATVVAGVAFSSLVGVFWFCVNYSLGLAAFWLEETWVLRVMFVTTSSFLSGAIVPLELYPAWLRSALMATPFPYVTYVPTKVFLGTYDGSFAAAMLLLMLWIGVAAAAAALVWHRGLRLYTAAGM